MASTKIINMNNGKNAFKRTLGHRTLFGIWSMLATAPSVELLSHAGFDWMLLDMEHGPSDISSLRNELMALNGSLTTPIVRAKWNDMVELKRILDLGVQTVMIPQVQNAEEARQAVAYTRYPPHGVRGVAGGTRATRYGRVKDYYQHADEEICVIVQVESRPGLDNLTEIASVAGVDAVFIGPADLAASLGHLGNTSHPDVQAAIEFAAGAIKATGKAAGTIATQEDAVKRMLALGFDFVAVGIDVGLLTQAADALAAKYISDGRPGDAPLSY